MKELQIKKHWLCYTPVWIIAAISTLMMILGEGFLFWLGCILVVNSILGYLTISNYKWTAKEGELLIESGVLPWQKNYIRVPAAGVFGATVKRDMAGWFLDYGTITINSLGGSSSPIRGTHMKGAVAFMEQITGKDHPYKSSALES